MTSPLALAMCAVLSLQGFLPLAVRDLGGTRWVAHVAAWTDSAARAEGLAPAYLAATLIGESGLDPNAVSKRGAQGLGQLLPTNPFGAAWLAECRVAPRLCAELNVTYTARAIRAALADSRGDRLAAVVLYRFGHLATPRPRDRHVVQLAQTIAWRMRGHRQTLVAWRGGQL